MPRQLISAIGLAALVLAFGWSASTSSAQDHAAPPGEAKGHAGAAAAAGEGHAAADEGHGAAGHGAEAQPNILEPQAPLAIWTVVVFLGLLFVLGKYAWKPLLGALHQREEHLEHV